MTTLPAAAYFTNASRTNAEAKQGLDDVLAVIRELVGGAARSQLTIAASAITPTGAYHAVETTGLAASSNLDNIVTTNTPDGRFLVIENVDPARTVVVRHNGGGTGNIRLADGQNMSLSDPTMTLTLQRNGTIWEEVDRFYGNNKNAARQYLRVGGPWTDVASAATVDLGAQVSTNLRLTGSTAITSFGTTAVNGESYVLRIAGSITITHNATSLICPGGVSLACRDGDTIQVTALGSGNWQVTEYLPGFLSATSFKAPVVVATTANITLSAPQTIDGIAVVAGDRVLVKDQTTASQNGIYVVAAGAWTRATDANTWADLPAAFVFVHRGTTNADRFYACTSDPGGTLGSTSVTWSQVGAGGTTFGTAVATTSGTSVSFTGIPAGINEIVVTFQLVSTTGTSPLMLQIGAGSTLSSGYGGTSSVLRNGSFPAVSNHPTSGFILTNSHIAAGTFSGSINLRRHTGNTWVCDGVLGDTSSGQQNFTGGSNATLSGALDRIVLTTQGGTDTFDGGSVNIYYRT